MEPACWYCDGRLRHDEGIAVPTLGGVSLHSRCMVALGMAPPERPQREPAVDSLAGMEAA